ncbi:hypothetical protein ES288_D01G060000v1 [Gossypium darwinii]|uniref:Leucine-rich repeat-containing N-terminal plant-type domain-containing protein n=1 Tax=Gossypium darwinii TaxID=34276 RepID=A0A5D2DM22_GOSDA|nr:hypothetical protein ES288_D01G060000v1 [Gossypium darwinii]
MANVPRFILGLTMAVLLPNFVVSFSTKTKIDTSTDQSALQALKAHVVTDPQKILETNWSITTSVCNWAGVTCGSQHQRVIALNLSNMLLTGTLPPQIGNLSFLTSLNLMNNSFHGSLPIQLANLHRLRFIELGENYFYEEIPSWFGSFPELQYLSLSANKFTGQIPSDMFERLPKLQSLNLGMNNLSGKIPIDLLKCKELQFINLESNRLEGILPEEIGNLTKLRSLHLDNNRIQGEIGDLLNLEQLTMSNNGLLRHPPTMYNLTRLRILDLSRNHLSGPIPFDFPSLLNLEQLNISFNMFGGSIPSTISNLTRLTILDTFTNYLSGEIPSDMFERLSKLQVLDLVSAWIPTSIPMSLFKCKELQIMNLVDCGFEGILPKEIGNLTMLRSLDLTYNEIEGNGKLLDAVLVFYCLFQSVG